MNYAREPDAVRAVPMGEGFIDYRGFFQALNEIGYDGYVAYERVRRSPWSATGSGSPLCQDIGTSGVLGLVSAGPGSDFSEEPAWG